MTEKIVIHNGMICDGSGKEPFPGELLIGNGRIEAVGHPGEFDVVPARRIDAAGNTVAPGFIDAHSHGDKSRNLLFPENRCKLLQGVTTEVNGNCGQSSCCVAGTVGPVHWENLAEYARIFNAAAVSTNTVVLCGHNSIRHAVMGNRNAKAAPGEISAMRKLMEESFASGAAGWSSGLTYFPGKFSDTAELIALAEVTRGTEKIYATHMRSEGDTLLEAVDETLQIAAAGNNRVQFSHLKTIFSRNFHKINKLLEKLETARNSEVFLHADRYPYIYSSTILAQTLPEPYNTYPDISERLRDSTDFQEELTGALSGSPRDLPTTLLTKKGQTLADIAMQKQCSVERACMLELMENPSANAAYLCMSPENLELIIRQPWVCAGSDGISDQLDSPGSTGHPRAVGTFPKFFRIARKSMSVGEAVRKMTSLPAAIFRIPERGLIKAGFIADLVIFDPEKYDSNAGFGSEDLLPQGVKQVWVNGKTAWSDTEPEKVNRYGKYIAVS